MPKDTPAGFAGLGDTNTVRPQQRSEQHPQPVAAMDAVSAKSNWKAQRRAVPLYLTHESWRQLRRLSLDTERSMSKLLIEGLDAVFAAYGLKSTKDLGE